MTANTVLSDINEIQCGYFLNGSKWYSDDAKRSCEQRFNHAVATSNALKGTTTWNDGVRNYRVKPGEIPEESWVKGMIKMK